MSSGVVTKTILIDGMTCVSCENRIERKLSETEGITEAKVSYGKGTAVISFDTGQISMEQIEKIIEELDYHVKKPEEYVREKKEHKGGDSNQFIGILVILFAVYMILRRFGVLQLFNAFPVAREGMGYGMLALIGILTSVHCVAMCGGICLSQCVPQNTMEGNKNKLSAFRPSLLYNLGRVISYTVIGGIVGALGSVVSFSGSLKGIVQIAAGIFMVIMGLNMLNIFPWLRRLNPRMPKLFARKINRQKRNSSPLIVGLLNGLMPCGPLQAMQLYALSTGNAFEGALSMFLFALGTVPLMLAFGAVSSLLSSKFTKKMMAAGAVLVIIMGTFMFQSGITLSGIAFPAASGSTNSNAATVKDGIQTVTSRLSSGRYEPITVQKGIPVKWTILAEEGDINGCNNSIIIPEYELTYDVAPGENVIEFIPTKSGTFPYSCWMGMIRSKITVVDDIGEAGETGNETAENNSGGNEDSTGSAPGGLAGLNRLAGYTIPVDKIAVAKISDGIQEVTVSVEKDRFTPAVIVMERGLEATLNINVPEVRNNNASLMFPDYNTELFMQEDDNQVFLIPEEDFDFSSNDYSFFAYVKVVDDLDNIDLNAIEQEVETYVPTIREITPGGYSPGASCH